MRKSRINWYALKVEWEKSIEKIRVNSQHTHDISNRAHLIETTLNNAKRKSNTFAVELYIFFVLLVWWMNTVFTQQIIIISIICSKLLIIVSLKYQHFMQLFQFYVEKTYLASNLSTKSHITSNYQCERITKSNRYTFNLNNKTRYLITFLL